MNTSRKPVPRRRKRTRRIIEAFLKRAETEWFDKVKLEDVRDAGDGADRGAEVWQQNGTAGSGSMNTWASPWRCGEWPTRDWTERSTP
ncbi:MAG: hypothetical protein U1F71_01745 [Verrucomicrobiaceae bacterium]